MNFIKDPWVHTYGKIKIKNVNNNNLVLHEIAITWLDTRWCSISRNAAGANFLQNCSKSFFPINLRFGPKNSVLVSDPVILDLKLQLAKMHSIKPAPLKRLH